MSRICLTEPARCYLKQILWDRKHVALFDRTVLRSGLDEVKLYQAPLYDMVAAHEHKAEGEGSLFWYGPKWDAVQCATDPRSAFLSLSKGQLDEGHAKASEGQASFSAFLSNDAARYLRHTLLWDIERKALWLAQSMQDGRSDTHATTKVDELAADLAMAVAVYEQLTRGRFDPDLLDDWGTDCACDGPKADYKIDAVVMELVREHFGNVVEDARTGKEDLCLCGQLGYCLKRAWEAVFGPPCKMTPRWWIEPVRLGLHRRKDSVWPAVFGGCASEQEQETQHQLMQDLPEVEQWEEMSLSPVALEGLLWVLNSIKPYLRGNEEQELRVFLTLGELWNEPAFLNTLPEHRSLGRLHEQLLASE